MKNSKQTYKDIGYEPRTYKGVLYTPANVSAGKGRNKRKKKPGRKHFSIGSAFASAGRAILAPFSMIASLFKRRKQREARKNAPLPILNPRYVSKIREKDRQAADLRIGTLPVIGPTVKSGAEQVPESIKKISERMNMWMSWKGLTIIGGSALLAAALVVALYVGLVPKYNVIVDDGGVISQYRTFAANVGEFIDSIDFNLQTEDVVEPSPETKMAEGLEIYIYRAFPVTIVSEDKLIEINIAKGTVEDALIKAGVSYDEDDIFNPALDALLAKGVKVEHYAVEVQVKTVEEKIAYKTIEKKDPLLQGGKTKVKQKGVTGLRSVEYKYIYKNGEYIRKIAISTEVLKKPVDKIVLVGSGHRLARYIFPDTRPETPPTPDEIKEVRVATYVTAYTHSGHTTARGNWPRPGTIAADPIQLPYGTKIWVPGYGYGVVKDTGSMRHRPQELDLDLFMNTSRECVNWGRKRNYTFYILK
ncbi:MAG: G5 domain-containing protein [Bacillota bacterium]|nr:G5 domain-containing protein [Bacillota bacterium]